MPVFGPGRVSIGFPDPVGSNLAEYGPERTHCHPNNAKNKYVVCVSETSELLRSETCSLLTCGFEGELLGTPPHRDICASMMLFLFGVCWLRHGGRTAEGNWI